jgi:Tol biopolymer transport system component
MRRTLLVTAIWTLPLMAADPVREQALQKAIDLMETKGDLAGATRLFEDAARSSDRSVAARALLYLGQTQERQGVEKARSTYKQIEREYGDQRETVAEAKRRLTALGGSTKQTSGLTARQVWTGTNVDEAMSLSADGTMLVGTHWDTGDVAIRTMASGEFRRLNLKTSWKESSDFAESPVFSPDRRQIAYAWYSDRDGRYQLRLVDAQPGAKPRTLFNNSEVDYIRTSAWSRDSQAILAGIWRTDQTAQIVWISPKDGSIKVLKSLAWQNPQRITLSPDARYIAYDVQQSQDSIDRDIHVLASDGSSESVLVENAAHDAALSWTPDSKHLLFRSNRSGRMDLWSVEVRDGQTQGPPRFVKSDIGDVEPIGFDGSGAFHYVVRRSEQDIFAVNMDAATGKARGPASRITQSFFGQNHRAVWSPDGRWVAFYSSRGHSPWGPGAQSLVVRSVNSGEEKVFPTHLTIVQRPVWAKDSSSVLMAARDRQARMSFHRVDIHSGRLQPVLDTGISFNPAVSLASDDRTIYAPVYNGDDKTSTIERIDLVSGRRTAVYQAPAGGAVTGLALSPDDRTLAFVLFAPDGERPRQQLAILSADGTGFRSLTVSGDSDSIVPVLGLAWSPDSRWVYFVRTKKPESELWRIPANGGAAEYTGVAAAEMKHIHMSADGSRLAFDAGRRQHQELWTLENVPAALRAAR